MALSSKSYPRFSPSRAPETSQASVDQFGSIAHFCAPSAIRKPSGTINGLGPWSRRPSSSRERSRPLSLGSHAPDEHLHHLPRHIARELEDRQIDPEAPAAAELFNAMGRIARDGERLDHPVGHGRLRLRPRLLVLIELRDLLAVVGEPEIA